MIKYPDDYNPIKEYWEYLNECKNTNIDPPGYKIYETYRKVIYDMEHPGKYFYSHSRANHILEFAENYCRHSKGALGGQLVELELWEKATLAAIFGFIDGNGYRKYKKAKLIVAKKNGKSLIASIVGLYLLVADGEHGPEVYAVATKRDQAKIIWQESKKMVRKSKPLLKRIRTLVAELVSDFNDGVYKPLASDSDTLDGLNIHGALMDEIHQWKSGKALYDIIADGVSARMQPLIFITSTAGTIREDIYDDEYEESERIINGYFDDVGYKDEEVISFIYELDNRKEWTDPNCWKKANPGLGTIKNFDTLFKKVERAKLNLSLVRNIICKEFNIPETSSESWLSKEQVMNEAVFDTAVLKPKYGIGGCDLSSKVDLTAAKIIFMVPGDEHIYVLQMYWIPADLVEQRTKEDHIPYDLWIEKGYCRTCPGNKNHPKYITEWFVEMRDKYDIYIPWIGYDAWSATYWVEEMQVYFGINSMIPVIQGKKTLSDPMKSLGADLDKKLIVYNNNPMDRWCLFNTAIDIDKNDNIQPIKTSKPTRRIDGTAALLDAYVVLQDKMAEYQTMI